MAKTLDDEAVNVISVSEAYVQDYEAKANQTDKSWEDDFWDNDLHTMSWVHESCVDIMKKNELDDEARDRNPGSIRRDSEPRLTQASDVGLLLSLDCALSANVSSTLQSVWKTAPGSPADVEARSSVLADYGSMASLCSSELARITATATTAQAVSLTQAPSPTASSASKTLSPRNTLATPTTTLDLSKP